MEPISILLFAVLPVVLLVLAASAFAARKKRAFEDALRVVGDARGLRLAPSTWRKSAYTRGMTEGVDVCLDTYVVSSGKSSTTYTRVRTRHPALPTSLRIVPEGMFQAFGKALGVNEDVEVGDARLDDVAILRGEPEAMVVARMDASARRAIGAAVGAGGKLEKGSWTITEHGLITDPARLEHLVRLAVGASRALLDGDPSPASLRARATDDPLSEVRERALALAVRQGAPDDWLAAVAGGDEPDTVLVAASARGEAGRQRLWWVVDQGRTPSARAAAIALSRLPPDGRARELERILLWHLDREPAVDLIEALGRVASVQAVADLHEVEGPFGLGAITTAARDAVRAIQSRAHGEAGGLALAQASGGELAEADEKSRLGRLSQARASER